MKIRSDFVSNSSSSSSIIAIGNEQSFKLNDLVKAIAKECMKRYKGDCDKSSALNQKTFNKCVLNFHWRSSECLYIGELVAGYNRICYDKKDIYFNNLSNSIKNNKLSDGIVVSHTSNEIVIDWPEQISSPAVPAHKMEYLTGLNPC